MVEFVGRREAAPRSLLTMIALAESYDRPPL